jgi:hypothetical protein
MPGTSHQVSISYYVLPNDAIDTIWIDDNLTVKTMTQQTFDDYINNTEPFPKGSQHILSAAAPCWVHGADFDIGGDGLAFNKQASPYGGGAYRANGGDPVDRVSLYFTGGNGIASSSFGDWQAYTVEVQDPGEYKIEINYSLAAASSLAICTVDALNFFGTISLANTNNWAVFRDWEVGTINLSAGKHKLRWTFTGGASVHAFMGFRFTKQ